MHVGELAKRTGVSIRSLHHYEQMGVLYAQRQANGYRCYDETAVAQIRHIRSLLTLGFTLTDIRLLVPCVAEQESGTALCTTALTRYQQKIAEIDEQIQSLQAIRSNIVQQMQAAQIDRIEEKTDDH